MAIYILSPPLSLNPVLQVILPLTFMVFSPVVSRALRLHICASLMIAALRCMAQLTIIAIVLQHVLVLKNIWIVAGIALSLNVLATFEIVVIRAERRSPWMFPVVLAAILASTIPVSNLGLHFAMDIDPFCNPGQYLLVLGMLCGNAIPGISVSVAHILKELDVDRSEAEVHRTTPFDAYRPLSVEALRLGLGPTICQLRVIGMITNPLMIARAILEGSYLEQTLRQQMITVFMITTSNVLSCVVTIHLVLWVCVDSEYRIRADCIDMRPHVLLRTYNSAIDAIISFLRGDVRVYSGGYPEPPSERTPLRN